MWKSCSNERYLLALLAVALCVILIFMYYFVGDQNSWWIELIKSVIPSFLAVLIGFASIYFFLEREGVLNPGLNTSKFGKELANIIQEETQPHQSTNPGILAFYENIAEVPWHDLFSSARSVDIVVYYYDSWVKTNWRPLVEFFGNGGALRIVLPNPDNDEIMEVVRRRFPENSIDMIRHKVRNTGERLKSAKQESGSQTARIEVFYFDDSLNYSAIRFDNASLLLSVFEQFRENRILSSAVLLDLKNSAHLNGYWDKEIGGFIRNSSKQVI